MSAHYDTYDYPSYWDSRVYEHYSEGIAISGFLKKIPKLNTILEIGSGFGRLFPFYSFRAKNIILSDPSSKLLSFSKKRIKNKKVKYIHSTLENLPKKIRNNRIDLAILVRVLHHIEDIDDAFSTINKMLVPGGYFILEFANKTHFKAFVRGFIHGNFTFLIDIFPKDIRSKANIKKGTISFVNYHPGVIEQKLIENNFQIVEIRSVSNIRSTFLKRKLPLEFICSIEKFMQTFLAKFSFGPSIFILARKKKVY